MSLFATSSFPANKGPGLIELACDDLGADFFDQFLTFDPIDKDSSGNPALTDSTLSAKPMRQNSTTAIASSLPSITLQPYHSAQPAFYAEASGRAAVSDSELLCLENISLGSPVSPFSPTNRAYSLPSRRSSSSRSSSALAQKGARVVQSIPQVFKRSHDRSQRSPIRRSQHPPNMTRVPESFQNNLDLWGNSMSSKFQYGFEHPIALSTPPQSARLSNASQTSISTGVLKDDIDDIFGFSNNLPHELNDRPNEYDTPLATPILEGSHSRKSSDQQQFSDGMGFPLTPQYHSTSASWSQLPASFEIDSYGTPVIHSSETESPVWWNDAAIAPMVQPSPMALHTNPRQATKSLAYQLQNEASYETNEPRSSNKLQSGLMIQMPEIQSHQSFVVTSPHLQSPLMSQQGYSGQAQQHTHRHQYTPPPRTYLPDGLPHHYQYPTSSMHRTQSTTRYESESPSPKSSASQFQVRKRRMAKGNKEKKSPSAGGVDFVNFTPSDSRKILTGVAPSGSSKTRARREKEAMEKRRRLSIAAVRAVRAAGGDVESLVGQGLFA